MDERRLDIKLDIAGKTYEMKIDPRNEEVYRLAAREINSRLTRAQRSHVDGFAMQDYLAVVAVEWFCDAGLFGSCGCRFDDIEYPLGAQE